MLFFLKTTLSALICIGIYFSSSSVLGDGCNCNPSWACKNLWSWGLTLPYSIVPVVIDLLLVVVGAITFVFLLPSLTATSPFSSKLNQSEICTSPTVSVQKNFTFPCSSTSYIIATVTGYSFTCMLMHYSTGLTRSPPHLLLFVVAYHYSTS